MTQCPAGTFQGNETSADCIDCPAGWYCEGLGNSKPTICPRGQYCPAKTDTPSDCPQGTWSDLQGLVDEYGCQLGDYGVYYTGTGSTSPNSGLDCDAGYKCYPDRSDTSDTT